jgi:hypothetical protein
MRIAGRRKLDLSDSRIVSRIGIGPAAGGG